MKPRIKGDERISNDNKLRNKAESSRKIKKEQQAVAEGDGDDLLAELLGDDMPWRPQVALTMSLRSVIR